MRGVGSSRRIVALAVLLAVSVLGIACSAGDPPTGSADAPSGTTAPGTTVERTYQFRTWDETYVDTSRSTPAGAGTPELPERTLVTTIRLPQGEQPFPLIVFSHGLVGHPRVFSELFDRWAAAGYAVAAPTFPLTNRDAPGAVANWSDLANQPGDVSFVLDQLLAANDDPSSPLFGRIDADRLGAAGLSLGGATTYGVVFNDCCRDERFTSAMVLAGATLAVSGDPLRLDGHVPLLIVHGTDDASLPFAGAHDTFVAADPPVWFVSVIGGSHAPPFEDDDTPYDATVERFTTAWWDATLGNVPDGFERFADAAAVDGLTEVEVKA